MVILKKKTSERASNEKDNILKNAANTGLYSRTKRCNTFCPVFKILYNTLILSTVCNQVLYIDTEDGNYNKAFSNIDESQENNADTKSNAAKTHSDINRKETDNTKNNVDEDAQHCVLRNILTLPKRDDNVSIIIIE